MIVYALHSISTNPVELGGYTNKLESSGDYVEKVIQGLREKFSKDYFVTGSSSCLWLIL